MRGERWQAKYRAQRPGVSAPRFAVPVQHALPARVPANYQPHQRVYRIVQGSRAQCGPEIPARPAAFPAPALQALRYSRGPHLRVPRLHRAAVLPGLSGMSNAALRRALGRVPVSRR
uniref:PTPA-CTERM sorting domain-containing protein n=1 Tax=Aurantiacibacter marinus TaxID=874156 RepID=UPI0012E02A35